MFNDQPTILSAPVFPELYPFQAEGVPRVNDSLREGFATLLVAPTGSGKTIMARDVANNYQRVLLVAHRQELIDQAHTTMGRHVQAMSVQAALRYGPNDVDLFIIDEAHRAAARTYRELIGKYGNAARLGLTATPLRTDGQGLCDAFDKMIEVSSVIDLVRDHHLVPYQAFEAPDEALRELTRLKKRGGDWATRELSAVMNQPRLVSNVVREYLKHGKGRKTVVFAVSVEHSKQLASAFTHAGIRAIHIDGRASPRIRSESLKALADGQIDVLCNVNLFTEGWDCPSVSCVIMARPTMSLTLYLQCIGRGMRPDLLSGKTDLLILDHAGNIDRHGDPDAPREWSLESAEQKAKREAEIAELERMHKLGFESLEQYQLERKRRRAESYTTIEAAKILGCPLNTVNQFLENCAVKHLYRGRYAKTDVDTVQQLLADTLSAAECRTIFPHCSSLSSFFRTANIQRVSRVRYARYLKRDVIALHELINSSYAFSDCVKIIGKSPGGTAWALKQAGIIKCFGSGAHTRFLKSAVDKYITEQGATDRPYTAVEVEALFRDAFGFKFKNGVARTLRVSFDIEKLGRSVASKYPKAEIDHILEIRRNSYSAKECFVLLREANIFHNRSILCRFLESNGVLNAFGFKGRRGNISYYLKRQVDELIDSRKSK